MPRLIFLGTGAAVPSKENLRHDSAAWLSYGKQCNILVNCGEGTKYNLLRAGLTRTLHHIFLTHDHYDHLMGLTGLLAMISLGIDHPPDLTLYGPPSALERAYVLADLVRSAPGATPRMTLHYYPLQDGACVNLGPVSVEAFETFIARG